jgi:glycosyltransferase involved in cell wall biosynthesis
MRILLVSNLYPPYVEGGAEILAHDVATELTKMGHEVMTLTSSYGLVKVRKDEGVWRTLRIFPVAHFDKRRSALQQFNQLYNFYRRYHCAANARELRRVIAETKPDVLYIWEVSGIGVTSLMKTLAHLNIPIVFHLGSYWLLYASKPETEQSRMKASALKQRLIGSFPIPKHASMIAVSETVKQQHVEAGIDAARIEVIYNGIDTSFLDLPKAERAQSEEKQPFQLLYVGRLRVEKGIAVIFKALSLLAKERDVSKSGELPFHLHIIGSGDKVYIDELQALLREKDLIRAVTFHGKIPQHELIAWYDHADVMLVPSLWQEPFGLVIAEGMARKLPVIASNSGGPAEILTHEGNGLLVTPGDEQQLAMAIGRLLDDQQLRERLGMAAHQTVEERFTIESDAKNAEQHLLRAIREQKK